MTTTESDELIHSTIESRKIVSHKIKESVSEMSTSHAPLLEIEQDFIIQGFNDLFKSIPEGDSDLAAIFVDMLHSLKYYPVQSYPHMLEMALEKFFNNENISNLLNKSKKLIILPAGYSEKEVKSYHLLTYLFKSNLFNYILQKNDITDLQVQIWVNPNYTSRNPNKLKDACFLLVDDYSASGCSLKKGLRLWSENIQKIMGTTNEPEINVLSLIIEKKAYTDISKSHELFFYKISEESNINGLDDLATLEGTKPFSMNTMNIMIRTPNNTPELIQELPPFQRIKKKSFNIQKSMKDWEIKWLKNQTKSR